MRLPTVNLVFEPQQVKLAIAYFLLPNYLAYTAEPADRLFYILLSLQGSMNGCAEQKKE